jgi:RNA polymerase sigma factor (sigma-70 family)
VERTNKGGAATVGPMTLEQLEGFYTAQYLKLVKILVLLFGATFDEAEDAVQKAMAYFAQRFRIANAPDHPAAYVQRAAVHYFIQERQRERERLPRELQGGHLVIEAHLDDRLTAWEEEQYVEHLLECLTPTQRKVIKLVMDGLSTREIAEELGKTDENIRQHLMNGRNRLEVHPEIAPHAPGRRRDKSPGQQEVRSTVTTPVSRKEEVQ